MFTLINDFRNWIVNWVLQKKKSIFSISLSSSSSMFSRNEKNKLKPQSKHRWWAWVQHINIENNNNNKKSLLTSFIVQFMFCLQITFFRLLTTIHFFRIFKGAMMNPVLIVEKKFFVQRLSILARWSLSTRCQSIRNELLALNLFCCMWCVFPAIKSRDLFSFTINNSLQLRVYRSLLMSWASRPTYKWITVMFLLKTLNSQMRRL